jgi:tetratricopeptide (TPR) repeat protein
MLKTRIILIVASAAVIVLLFTLPRVVVENTRDEAAGATQPDSAVVQDPHASTPAGLRTRINAFVSQYKGTATSEKSAIFADSLADLYAQAGQFDSAGWYAEQAATFFNNEKSWIKAGEQYYQAYTFALDQLKQAELAEKTRTFFGKVLEKDPDNLDAKTKMAMTYMSSGSPMQGVMMLREVLAADPRNELALFNLGMLSIQSGQYDKAVSYLKELTSINERHIQGQLLLGLAYMEKGDKKSARTQFEKVKEMDKDPAVQATVDSYLKDLK